MSAVVRHVVESIGQASAAHAEGARQRVAGAGAPVLERLAAAIGGAQHSARVRSQRRTVVVCAGDHGAGDPGIALGAAHPTVIAACAIADGSAALATVARAANAQIILVDAGVVERAAMPAMAIQLGRSPSGALGSALTPVEATLGLEAGIALAVSLVDAGLDVVAVGALGVGADIASAALVAAATGVAPSDLGDPEAEATAAHVVARNDSGLGLLAAYGGPETAVLAGLMLACASMNVPVILDGYATGAAALVAARLAPAITGYLVAAHAGSFTHPQILAALGLAPIFEVGLGHGEGTGAAMVLPLIDQVAAFG